MTPDGAPARLASHVFVPVGDSRSVAGFGELLEVIDFEGEPVVVGEGEVTALDSGISCLRFRYRGTPGENGVQTMCVVAFDEAGDCAGLEPLELDLDTYLDPDKAAAGNSNALVGGELYAACRTPDGSLRLQQPQTELPKLFFNIVDALGEGPYSLGDSEVGPQRDGYITTFGGEVLSPPWIVTVSREVSSVEWLPDGTFVVNGEDCSQVPSCGDDPSLVRRGDVLMTSLGMSPEQLQTVMDAAEPATLDSFVSERVEIPWDEIAGVHPDAVLQAFNRLAVLDIMDTLLTVWDDAYLLREKEVVIGYAQPWFAETALTAYCYPDPAEQTACLRMESAISDYEQVRIAEWRRAGFRLWQAGFLSVAGQVPPADRRPHWSAFEGVIAGVGAPESVGPDLRQIFGRAVRALATEIDNATPVMLFMTGGPIGAQTGDGFCEADICPSDFAGAYEMAEGALAAALEVFTPGQLQGFGAALFEGSHFDIRHPYEVFGYPLNRVGETGYNHPILNVWRAS